MHTPPPQEEGKIGTQARPLETVYYDLLGVPVDATADDIKKAYRRLSIWYYICQYHHPDLSFAYPNTLEGIQSISNAYQILYDPQLRDKYNKYGPNESIPEGGFLEPEDVFAAIIGGKRFLPLIGELTLAHDLKLAFRGGDAAEGNDAATPVQRDDQGREIISPEERARRHKNSLKLGTEVVESWEARIQKLAENLRGELDTFMEMATDPTDPDAIEAWRRKCTIEAEALKGESCGVDLLNAIGFVYTFKAKQFLASNLSFRGVSGWLYYVQGIYHRFSNTMSTLFTAIGHKTVFEMIRRGQESGALGTEEKKRLEEEAGERGLQALFKGAKLEITSVLKEVCERVLNDATISRDMAILRATALQTRGDVFTAVRRSK